MFQRKPRRFRPRTNGRSHQSHQRHSNGESQGRIRSHSFSNDQRNNNFRQSQSAEKLFEKYSTLAKEAMSSGDKTLSENYFQHADHYRRVIDERNLNQKKIVTQNGINETNSKEAAKNLSNNESKPELGNNENKPEVSEVKKENQNT